jgi:hypothetical protein
MFNTDELIELRPIFQCDSEEEARQLSAKLEELLQVKPEISLSHGDVSGWSVICSLPVSRKLNAQKQLHERLSTLAQKHCCTFLGWRHTLNTDRLH